MNYVCGFYFLPDNKILLVRKQRPAWQKGMLNGVGGKIEPGEHPAQAMAREFSEETHGLVVKAADWEPVAIMSHGPATIHFYTYTITSPDAVDLLHTWLEPHEHKNDVSEPLCVCDIGDVLNTPQLMRNLNVLIPLAKNPDFVKPLVLIDTSSIPV